MNKSEVMHIRIEPDIKKQSEEIFARLGINTTQAFSIFLNKVIMENGLPFDVRINDSKANELASMFSSLGGKAKVSKEREAIIDLFAQGKIDYETACFAIKRIIEKETSKNG